MFHYSHIQAPSDVVFRNILFELHDFKNRQYDLGYYNTQLQEILLSFGSQTPDNLNTLTQIVYGNVGENWSLKLKAKPILIIDAWKKLEGTRLPKYVQHTFPDINQQEWQAVIQFISLILKDITSPFGLLMSMKEVWEIGKSDRFQYSKEKINQKLFGLLEKQKQSSLGTEIMFDKAETPENWVMKWGLKTRLSHIFLSDIVAEIEGMPISTKFLQKLKIEKEDWEAVMRVIILIVSVFEGSQQMSPEELFL